MDLIDQALAGNRELKILNEEVQIASNEILRGKGRTFPSSTSGPAAGLDKPSRFTLLGAGILRRPVSPRAVPSQSAAEFPARRQLLLAAGHLEAVAECQGRGGDALLRRHRGAELLRDPPGRGDCRELLQADGARQTARESGSDHRSFRSKASRSPRPGRKPPAAPSWPSSVSRPRSAGTRAKS